MMSRTDDIYGKHTYVCKECGRLVNLALYSHMADDVRRMEEGSACMECLSWLNMLSNLPTDCFIINGQLVKALPASSDQANRKYILTINKKIIVAKKIILCDEIPLRFKNRFPDNAKLISGRTNRSIQALKKDGFVCRRKGCWDRRTCYWYRGPMKWNVIPASHKDGGEECPVYINAKTQ